jgi:hypothetical protein
MELAKKGAELKASKKMSYADGFAAALARLRKAELVTGDKEFKQVASLLTVEVFQTRSLACPEAGPCRFYSLKKPGVILKPILKPVVFTLKAHEKAGRLAMPRDDDFFLLGYPEIS